MQLVKNDQLKFDFDESILLIRGRNGAPDRSLRFLNRSQYLDQFNPTITSLNDITSLCLDGMRLITITPLEFIFVYILIIVSF